MPIKVLLVDQMSDPSVDYPTEIHHVAANMPILTIVKIAIKRAREKGFKHRLEDMGVVLGINVIPPSMGSTTPVPDGSRIVITCSRKSPKTPPIGDLWEVD